MLLPDERALRDQVLSQAFTPSSPIDDQRLFAGRRGEVMRVQRSIETKGQHAIIYGERGVGKTSLSNYVGAKLREIPESRTVVAKVTCNTDEDFNRIVRRLARQIPLAKNLLAMPSDVQTEMTFEDTLPRIVTPDEARSAFSQAAVSRRLLLVIDEFDQISDAADQRRFANLIKALSDNADDATLILVGVSDSVANLLTGHHSIERALMQIQMPRMSAQELSEIVTDGLARAEMRIAADALGYIATISQGLPHYAHLLGLESGRTALQRNSLLVEFADVKQSLGSALQFAQESIKSAFHAATTSPRKDNLFRHVLLACALAPVDEFNYFSPADVRPAFQLLTGNPAMNAFLQHLKSFTEARGKILEQTGVERKYRYRFVNPIMRPYVIMKGLSDGLITDSELSSFAQENLV